MTPRNGLATRPWPRLLVLGDEKLAQRIRVALPEVVIDSAETADESEGLNIAAVVIAGVFPLLEATQVRVHPSLLEDIPMIVVAPSRMYARMFVGLDIDVVVHQPDDAPLLAAIRLALGEVASADLPEAASRLEA